ncbi:uncharacterized protein TRAVEDRAFT_48915 [Trametes versicolor FP-101664 SS1]|uniref:uncharacterized protein n=1 Tax=Trametes versicolor (strain FP-101664) TaxID=717944 RepID=UPI00046230F8|nr:uncharacterized protein TRAVEDRAFT_48915 [Trametes versicolor FP-101664 SS1]EIW57894.1 hypothetical protein TRAVEDRAFT_48915 [Trametes versicolor FP-101664 SS1]
MDSLVLEEASAALQKTYGAYLLGTCLSIILYGVSLHQFFLYVRMYPSDTPFIRALVVAVMLLETVQVPMLMHTWHAIRPLSEASQPLSFIYSYWALVTHFFDPGALTQGIWSVEISPTISALITLTAQAFFARRVALLGFKYRIVVGIAWFCLITFLGMAIAVTVISTQLHNLTQFGRETEWLFSAGLWFATVADMLLSGSIIIALRSSPDTYNPRGVQCRTDRFMLYVVNTGLMTGIFNIIPSILATMDPKTFIWAASSYVGTRLYANTLFAVLNSRNLMASRGIEIFGPATLERNIIARVNHIATAEQWGAPQLPVSGPAKINIMVTAESEMDSVGTIERRGLDKRDYADTV